MENTEPTKLSGRFWLPNIPDEQLAGCLSISGSGMVTLELLVERPLRPDKSLWPGWGIHVRRILGKVEGIGPVTLEDCLWQHTEQSLGLTRSTFHSTTAYIGASYNEDELARFTEFRLSVTSLHEWLVMSTWLEEVDGPANYYHPEEITLRLAGESVRVEFRFESLALSPCAPRINERSVEKAYVALITDEPKQFEFFRSLAFKLCNFMSLAFGQAATVQSINAFLEAGDNDEQVALSPPPIHIHGRFVPWWTTRNDMQFLELGFNYLFSYSDLIRQIEPILEKWITSYKTVEPAIELLVLSLSEDSSAFPKAKFLHLVQAIETLHRRINPEEKKMCEAEFEAIRDSMLQACPEEKRKEFSVKLGYFNELSLRKRVRESMKPLKKCIGENNKARDEFIRTIVDTRNFLTHYNETVNDKIAKGQALETLSRILVLILQINLLLFLEFNSEVLDASIERNKHLFKVAPKNWTTS